MNIKDLQNFKKELLNLRLEDLRDSEQIGALEEIRLILYDIFTIFKLKSKPFVLNFKNKNDKNL